MAIELVLCDLGGVLIEYSFDLAVRSWARAAGIDLAEVRRMDADELWRKFEVGAVGERAFFNHLRRRYGLPLGDDEMINGWNAIYIGIDDAVAGVLRDVKDSGKRLVAVTNTNKTHQLVWIHRFAAELAVFSTVYSSCEIGHRKPRRCLLPPCPSAEQLAPHQALLVDDIEENIRGAARIGILALRFRDSARLREELVEAGVLRPDGRC